MKSIKDIISKRQNNFRIDISTFRVVKELQSGTNGSVYCIENIKTEKYFAGKTIKCNEDDEKIKRIINRDIINMIRCQHPTLIKYYSYSLVDFFGNKNLTLILDLETNGSLANAIAQAQNGVTNRNYKNSRQVILVGIARGMMYLHQHNILHRNLNPGNILLDEHYRPHISNFCLSKIYENSKNMTQDFSYGTIIYKAPEVLSNNFYNSKSDVYSFGIIMYEILTDTTPYPLFQKGRMAALQFSRKVISENYRPKFTVPIKKSFRNLIERCISKNPNNRPSFEEIFKMLAYNIEDSFIEESDEKEVKDSNDHNYYLDNIDIDYLFNYIDDITKIDGINEDETMKTTIEELKKDNKELQNDNEQMKQQISQLKKQNLQLSKKIEENFAPLKNEFEQLKKDNEQMRKLIQQLIIKIPKPNIPPLALKPQEDTYIPDERSISESTITSDKFSEISESHETDLETLSETQSEASSELETSSSPPKNTNKKEFPNKKYPGRSSSSSDSDSDAVNILSSDDFIDISDETDESDHKKKKSSKEKEKEKENREITPPRKRNDLSIRVPGNRTETSSVPNSPGSKTGDDSAKLNSPRKGNQLPFRLSMRKFEKPGSNSSKNKNDEEEKKSKQANEDDSKRKSDRSSLQSLKTDSPMKSPPRMPDTNDRRSYSPARKQQNEGSPERKSLLSQVRKNEKEKENNETKGSPSSTRKTNESSTRRSSVPIKKFERPTDINDRRSNSPARKIDKSNDSSDVSSLSPPATPPTKKSDNKLERTNRRTFSLSLKSDRQIEDTDRRAFSARRIEPPDRRMLFPIKKTAKSSSDDEDERGKISKIHLPKRSGDNNDDEDYVLPSPRFKPPPFNETNMSLDRFNALPLKFQKSFISELIKKTPSKFDQELELLKELLRYLLQFNPSINSIHYLSLSTGKAKESYTNANEWCQDINEVHLLSAATEILYLNDSLDAEGFIDIIRQFGSVSIELKYPSENFKGTYEIASDIKRLQVTKLKLAISISGLSTTDEMFKKSNDINSVKLDTTVNAIGKNSFRNCSNLIYVSISSTVNSIGNDAFRKCSALTQINLPPSVVTIGDGAFSKCTALKTVTIPSSVKAIGEWAFNECTSLKSIEIPNSVVSIGEWALSACSSLKEVVIPSSLKSIAVSTFADCTALEKVKIPNSVSMIGNWAFCKCSALKEVDLPSSLTAIGEGAFSKCFALAEIEIPHKVTSIRSSTFADCSSLENVVVPSSVTTIEDNAFSGCFSLTKITLPRSVTSIGYWSFPSNTIIKSNT